MLLKGLKKALVYIVLNLTGVAFVATLLLIGVYALPSSPIRLNAQQAALTLSKEGDVPSLMCSYYGRKLNSLISAPALHHHGFKNSLTGNKLDNFSPAIMINNAAFLGRSSIILDAITNPRTQYTESSQVSNLYLSVNTPDINTAEIINYARYWHGYLIFLKPLLIFFDLTEIRILNAFIQILLLILCLYLLSKRINKTFAFTFFLTVLFINPLSTVLSLQYTSAYCLSLIAIAILLSLKENKNYWPIFFYIGIIIAFVDLFSFPLITLGLPLIVYIHLYQNSFRDNLVRIISSSSSWAIGYFGFWFIKWVIATIFTNENIIKDGLNTFLYRTTGYNTLETWDTLFAIEKNFSELATDTSVFIILIYLLGICLYLLKEPWHFKKDNRFWCLIIIATYPFLWYAVVTNHSVIHSLFTYRNLSISIFALTTLIFTTIAPTPKTKVEKAKK